MRYERGYDFSSNSDVEVAVVADLVGDESKNLLTDVELADGDVDDLKFNASTIVMNINADDTEIVKNGWAALINSDDEFAPINGDSYIFYKGSKVIYFVADFEDYQSSEAEYAAITDISYVKNSDDDKVWEVTLYHEGETVVYELADEDLREEINEGDFVEYTISDDEIDYIATMIAYKAIEDLEDADEIADYLADGESATILSLDDIAAKGQIVVDSIEDGWVIFSDDEDVDGDDEGDSIGDVEICEDGYVIYDLTREEMVDDIDDIIGAYVIGIELTDDDGAEIFVIVK